MIGNSWFIQLKDVINRADFRPNASCRGERHCSLSEYMLGRQECSICDPDNGKIGSWLSPTLNTITSQYVTAEIDLGEVSITIFISVICLIWALGRSI